MLRTLAINSIVVIVSYLGMCLILLGSRFVFNELVFGAMVIDTVALLILCFLVGRLFLRKTHKALLNILPLLPIAIVITVITYLEYAHHMSYEIPLAIIPIYPIVAAIYPTIGIIFNYPHPRMEILFLSSTLPFLAMLTGLLTKRIG